MKDAVKEGNKYDREERSWPWHFVDAPRFLGEAMYINDSNCTAS
jgi:hypothetical protein